MAKIFVCLSTILVIKMELLIFILLLRKRRDEAEINNMSWLIKSEELTEVKGHGKSMLSLGSRISMLSKQVSG